MLLAVPRVSPEWELAALRALIKPQTKGAVVHRDGLQPWSPHDRQGAGLAVHAVGAALAFSPAVHLPEAGEYHLLIRFDRSELDAAKALALVLSRRLPDRWLVLGRLLVRNGRFFRRQRGYKLLLKPAAGVHVPRAMRSVLRGLL